MAMGRSSPSVDCESLGVVDDVHELVVDHSDSSANAEDIHEIVVEHSESASGASSFAGSSEAGGGPDEAMTPAAADLERGVSAIDLIEHELLAAAEEEERADAKPFEESYLDAAAAAVDSAEAKHALDAPPEHVTPKLTHAKLSWTDIMRGDIIDDEAEDGDGGSAARPQRRDGPPPPLPDEVRPWKAPNNTLAARLISCWTCDQSISCLRVPLHKKSASGKHSRPGPASPSDI